MKITLIIFVVQKQMATILFRMNGILEWIYTWQIALKGQWYLSKGSVDIIEMRCKSFYSYCYNFLNDFAKQYQRTLQPIKHTNKQKKKPTAKIKNDKVLRQTSGWHLIMKPQ